MELRKDRKSFSFLLEINIKYKQALAGVELYLRHYSRPVVKARFYIIRRRRGSGKVLEACLPSHPLADSRRHTLPLCRNLWWERCYRELCSSIVYRQLPCIRALPSLHLLCLRTSSGSFRYGFDKNPQTPHPRIGSRQVSPRWQRVISAFGWFPVTVGDTRISTKKLKKR